MAKVPEPPKYHFAVGTALHEVLERFQVGEPIIYPEGWDAKLTVDDSRMVQDRVDYAIEQGIVDYRPGAQIEVPICLLTGQLVDGLPMVAEACTEVKKGRRVVLPPTRLHDGHPLPPDWADHPHYVGFIDLYLPPSSVDELPCVWDHKTAKSRKYSKKKEDIKAGLQLPSYSAYVFGLLPHIETVRLGYNVFLKDTDAPTPAYQIDDVITRGEAAARWQKVLNTAITMSDLRINAPAGPIGSVDRACLWDQVPGQTGRPDTIKRACEAYGGCPFKDLCFGRASVEQVTARLDREAKNEPIKPVSRTVSFGLIEKGKARAMFQQQEGTAPTFGPGQDVYVKDPSGGYQYKARIVAVKPQLHLILWPDIEVEPRWSDIDPACELKGIISDVDLLSHAPHDVPIKGYEQEVLEKESRRLVWHPLNPGSPANPWAGAYKQDAPDPRELPDPDQGCQMPTYRFVVGDRVLVADNDANKAMDRWRDLIGKVGTVTDVVDDAHVTMDCDTGHYTVAEFYATHIGRLLPASADADADAETTDTWKPQTAVQKAIVSLVGEKVHATLINGNPLRGKLLNATAEGIEIESCGEVPWAKISGVVRMEEEPTPGDDKDKARVEHDKELEGKDHDDIIQELMLTVTEALGKKTPSLGKRVLIRFEELLRLLQERTDEMVETIEKLDQLSPDQIGDYMAADSVGANDTHAKETLVKTGRLDAYRQVIGDLEKRIIEETTPDNG